ncbi:high-affinity iron permease [Irineochytrium annulatum]|nr:high-affinity iron permease [Irineochytrium annulatum]
MELRSRKKSVEATIILAVLLSFIHQSFEPGTSIRKRMTGFVWLGTGLALAISVVVGTAFLVVWFKYATNLWCVSVQNDIRRKKANDADRVSCNRETAEDLWEGTEGLLAAVLLTFLAFTFLQAEELTKKWHKRLRKHFDVTAAPGDDVDAASVSSTSSNQSMSARAFEWLKTKFAGKKEVAVDAKDSSVATLADGTVDKQEKEKAIDEPIIKSGTSGYSMFILPFVTVLREGLECFVFIGGIGISSDPATIPLAAIVGLASGAGIGYAIYKAGNSLHIRTFFFTATVILLVMSLGLLSRSVVHFQRHHFRTTLSSGVDLSEGSDGVYDVNATWWYLDCCNPEEGGVNGGWQLLAATVGWDRIGTYASVGTYIAYCVVISLGLIVAKVVRLRKFGRRMQKRAARRQLEERFDAQPNDAQPNVMAAEPFMVCE